MKSEIDFDTRNQLPLKPLDARRYRGFQSYGTQTLTPHTEIP